MELVLILLGLCAACEILFLKTSRQITRSKTDSLSLVLVVTSGLLLYERFSWTTTIVVVLMIYRVINLTRITHRKLQADYVNHLALRSSAGLILLQTLVLLLLFVENSFAVRAVDWLTALAVLDLVGAGVLAHTIDHQGRATIAPSLVTGRADHDLPSLTVAIPARNETADLEACLQSLVHSNYLKLEILVLDDCSQNTRTPEIIRQFAHDGVRFIAGSPPPDTWLAKNYAYQQLVEEANGELILFCGVDVRFEPDGLGRIVETMLDKRKTMVSVMPRNTVPGRFKLEAMLVQPGRYAWELALPRRWLDRPPVLSSCWLVQSQLMVEAGGMAAVKRAILPERFFARYAATHHDGYSFVQSGDQLGVATTKSFNEQRSTAVRTRYPGLHRRIELTAFVSLAEFMLLVAPVGGLAYSLLAHLTYLAILYGVSCCLLAFLFAQTVRITYQQLLIRGLWLLPFAAVYDIGLLNYSMWQYEFGQVIWKGRNVCIPVMRVIPHLPSVDRPFNQRHHRKHRHRRR